MPRNDLTPDEESRPDENIPPTPPSLEVGPIELSASKSLEELAEELVNPPPLEPSPPEQNLVSSGVSLPDIENPRLAQDSQVAFDHRVERTESEPSGNNETQAEIENLSRNISLLMGQIEAMSGRMRALEMDVENIEEDNHPEFDLRPASDDSGGGGGGEIFWAKLTSHTPDPGFDWQEIIWDDGEDRFTTLSGGRSGSDNAYHHVGFSRLPVGLVVRMEELLADEGDLEYVFTIPHDGDFDTYGITGGSYTRLDFSTGEEGTEAIQTDSGWNIESSQQSTFGVVVPVCTRVVYKDDGDEKLYGYTRDLTFDTGGRLLKVSAEVRYEIDEPVEC